MCGVEECPCRSFALALARVETLTIREREVFEIMSGGETNDALAGRLFITERTVRAHLAEIQRKLGLGSRVRMCMASYLHRHGHEFSSANTVAVANGSDPARLAR